LSILHVSDTHMKRGDRALQRFLEKVPDELGAAPDLVLATGDLIENDEGIDPLIEAFGKLDARLGRFYVLGSHDYYQSRFHAYTKYFTGQRPVSTDRADTERLEMGLLEKGWHSLLNSSESVDVEGDVVRLTGVDDPYIKRHRTEHIARESGDAAAIGLMHAPDLVSQFSLAGFDLVLAGHTHAGQVRFPFAGAVVTNCSLPAALAGGLHRVGGTWLHVSPGLGTGKFAPIRINCPPEITLLLLEPVTAAA
jgi:predicted MPP superfamily phosphohydrolase